MFNFNYNKLNRKIKAKGTTTTTFAMVQQYKVKTLLSVSIYKDNMRTTRRSRVVVLYIVRNVYKIIQSYSLSMLIPFFLFNNSLTQILFFIILMTVFIYTNT